MAGWDLPGLDRFFAAVSFLTDNYPAAGLGIVGIAFFFLLGKTRAALEFGFVGAAVGVVAVYGDSLTAEILGRTRPLGDNPEPSFPSGHVFGVTVFLGFWGFMAAYYRLRKRFLLPLIILFAILILAIGPARIYEQAHWPSDVAAAYLLGALWLLLTIPLFLRARMIYEARKRAGEGAASASGEQKGFAEYLPGGHHPVGLGSLGQGEGAVDHGLQASLEDQPHDRLQLG